MATEYLGLNEIDDPLVILEGVQNAAYDEIVEMTVAGNLHKIGRIIEMYGDKAIIQVLEGTDGMVLHNTHTRLTGHPMETEVSEETSGRTFNGIDQPTDGLGDIISDIKLDISGKPLNPATREYPRNYIRTGTSVIDGLTTLIHGQKLPTLSGDGLPHDQLAVQIVQQASLRENLDEELAIVFGITGVKYGVVDFSRHAFEGGGVSEHVAMFTSPANDPVAKRLIIPKITLTLAEYLVFEKGMYTLAILMGMTSYAEATCEVSSSKGKTLSRKGFPDYLYSDLASLYEKAGIVAGWSGSVTQIPILTIPNDDVIHPIPNLAGYITEGQIVLDRQLDGQNIYPPINVLLSLPRLMKDGIGEGHTRADHQDATDQLFSRYVRAEDARALASVIGEDELSPIDKKHLEFGKALEEYPIGQVPHENRTILDTLDIGWKLLGMPPREEPGRIGTKVLDQYYRPADTMKE